MTDTQWADISEWQAPVNDSYPYDFICIRSNDGNHVDKNIQANLSWCKSRRSSGKLWGFMAYYFYLDDPRRVVGYGNTSDLGSLWPTKPSGLRLVIAAYGSNPSYPGKFAHQFTEAGTCAPFGTCDMNSADGMSQQDLQDMFGFSGPVPVTPQPATAPAFPYPAADYLGTPSSDPHCHSGQSGAPDSDHVKAWQEQMAARGWTITADGQFGSQSQSVCRQFQQEKGLSVDGLVGSKTWQASWNEPIT